MAKTMLINAVEPEESRIAIVDQETNVLEELYIERASEHTYLGNIYKGRVVNIEPSIQAAFVDFGGDKNGFLHASDIMSVYGRLENGKASDKRDIQSLLRKGQEVVVQITKDSIGTKVPTLTTYISLPGRYLVLMPSINKCGVSKKISDETERRKLRLMLQRLSPPPGMGYIIRTAGADRSQGDLARDLEYLLKLWGAILKRVRAEESPVTLYEESDLVIRTIRDIYEPDITKITIDEKNACRRARAFLEQVMPHHLHKAVHYTEPEPLFHRFKIEEEIERIYDRKVNLKSGGSIIIEQTEALVSIDVNSGKFKDLDNLEDTAYQTNLEAAKVITRQLKLRDMGGLIVCDFIDMKDDRHRQTVERYVRQACEQDRARTRVAKMSKFCILELTRQRVRKSIKRTSYDTCQACNGTGLVKNLESMGLKIMRQIRCEVAKPHTRFVEVLCHPDVAHYLQRKKQGTLTQLESKFKKKIIIRANSGFKKEEYRFKD